MSEISLAVVAEVHDTDYTEESLMGIRCLVCIKVYENLLLFPGKD